MTQTPIRTRSDCSSALAVCMVSLLLLAQPVAAQEDGTHAEQSDDHHHEEAREPNGDDDDHLAELEGFRVVHGWTNATSGDSTLVFMDLENTGADTVSLVGADAEIAAQATLVGFRLVDGVAGYEALPSVPLSSGRKMQLAPNGLAIELAGLSKHLHEGDQFDIELHTSLGHIEIHVDVESADAMRHSHAGHAH